MTGITIEPYDLPTAVPASTAAWRAHPGRAALLIHDMQRYFVGFYPEDSEPRRTLVENVVTARETAGRLGIPVFYTAQPGSMTPQDRGLLRDIWGPGMKATAADRQVIDELAPTPSDVVLTKWRYSAFFRTDLLDRLRAAGRDQLIVCGIYAHVGCLVTAVEAFTHDIETFFVADAVADFGPDEHRLAVDYAAANCAVATTTAALVGELEGAVVA
jgi:isochorismate hydrolase